MLFIYISFVYTFPFSFILMSANTLEADSGNNWVYPKVLSLYETVISIYVYPKVLSLYETVISVYVYLEVLSLYETVISVYCGNPFGAT